MNNHMCSSNLNALADDRVSLCNCSRRLTLSNEVENLHDLLQYTEVAGIEVIYESHARCILYV